MRGVGNQGKCVLIFSFLPNYDGVKCITDILIAVVYLTKIVQKTMFPCVNTEFLKVNVFPFFL